MKLKMIFLMCCIFLYEHSFCGAIAKGHREHKEKRDATTTKNASSASTPGAVEKFKDVAIVDMKKIASSSKAGKSIELQISEINNESKKDLLDLESKIKSMESSKTSDEDARKIEDMQLILYDMVRTKRYQISEAYKSAVSEFEEKMKKSIANVAKKHAVKMVITSDAVVYFGDDCVDITDDVIADVNAASPTIKVELRK